MAFSKAQDGWNKTREGRWMVADSAWEAIRDAEYGDGAAVEFGNGLTPPIGKDSVYRMAKAGEMSEKLAQVDASIVAHLRKCLMDTYFTAVADLVPQDAIEWLMQADEERWNIEKFRAEVNETNKPPMSVEKKIAWIERHLINTPALGWSEQYPKVRRAALLLVKRLTRIGGTETPADSGR